MSSNAPPSEDYIFKSVPQTPMEQKTEYPAGKETDIIAAALRHHIESSFSLDKVRQLIRVLDPTAMRYFTVASGRDSKRQTPLQIGTLIQQLPKRIPAVLINETSRSAVPFLDDVQYSRRVEDKFLYRVDVTQKASIELIYADHDKTSAGELRSVLNLVFGVAAGIQHRRVISGRFNNAYWEVRLPRTIQDLGNPERESIGEDDVDSYYRGSLSLEVDFEASQLITTPAAQLGTMAAGIGTPGTYHPGEGVLPSSVSVGAVQFFNVTHMPIDMEVRSNNPEVLTIQLTGPDSFQLFPRLPGEATIQFLKNAHTQEVLYSHPLTVTAF